MKDISGEIGALLAEYTQTKVASLHEINEEKILNVDEFVNKLQLILSLVNKTTKI
jgi:hypothetical protein